jgi:hypothetical protein
VQDGDDGLLAGLDGVDAGLELEDVPAQRVGGAGGVGICAADEAAGGGGLGTGTLVDGSRRREELGFTLMSRPAVKARSPALVRTMARTLGSWERRWKICDMLSHILGGC